MTLNSDPITAMAVEIAKNDAEIEQQVRRLAKSALDHAQYILNYGTPALKMQVIKSVLPAMTKELAREQENDIIAEMRNEMAAMFDEMRGGVPESPSAASEDEDELA